MLASCCSNGSVVSITETDDSYILVIDGVPTVIQKGSAVSVTDTPTQIFLTVDGVTYTIPKTVVASAPITGNGTAASPLTIAPGTFVTPAELSTLLASYLTKTEHTSSLIPVYGNDGSTVLFRPHAV